MAVDTAQKRFSMINFGFAWGGGMLPVADGSDMNTAAQRSMMLGGYSGLPFGGGGIGSQTPAYRAGGYSFDIDGRLLTMFLLDGEPVPAGSSFHGGIAYDPVSGARYVCPWPSSGITFARMGGAAIRSDGAQTITDGTIELSDDLFSYTQRGELIVTIALPSYKTNGFGFDNGKLCITEIN